MIQSGAMARIGPFGISAYICLKSSAELHSGQAEHVSASLIAAQTGMSERAAREAVKTLEAHGLVRSTWRVGRKKVFQLVERIPILTADGKPAGEAAWDFAGLKWGQQLKEVVDGALLELHDRVANSQREPHSTTINIGSINVNVQVTTVQQPEHDA
jgi:biotin operon repressor